MAEPFKSTPASRVFGMGLPRRKVDNPGTIFGIEVDEPRWSLDPRLRRDMAEEQEMALQEQALAAKQADIERQIQGQEAMSRAFSGIEQGEEIENIFRKNPAIVYSPQFGQLYQASNLMEPSKASKTLVPNLAKSLPPEFRSEFLATASDPKYLNDPLGAYTAIEMKKNIADQRGRLRAMGVDVSKLKPDYYYTPEEESDFKSKLSIEAKMAEIEQKKSEERERDLQEAKKWALKRGAQENMVNLLDSPSAIYQLGASIGGSRSGTASRDIIDRRSKIFNIAKDELEYAKRDFRDSAYDEPDVVEAKKKMLNDAQVRYNQAKSDFEGALIEPPMEEDGVMGMKLPDYAPYSPEFRAGFASAAGSPAFGVPLGGRSTVPAKGRVAGETATNITSPAAMGGVAPNQLAPAVEAQKPLIDINAQLESLPFAEQKAFLEKKNAEEAALKEIAPAWDKAKTDIEKQILKVVPDKPLPGTKVNELESFAKAVLNPNENIITHPEYGTIPVAWDILNKAGVPMADIMTNKTVFRQPGEGRRLFGVIGTQQVGYQELLKEWAKSFLNSRGKLLPTSQSPSGSTLTEQQQKDLDELSSLVRSK